METDSSAGELSVEQREPLRETLLASQEGRLLLIGVALAFIHACWLIFKLAASPEAAQALIGATVAAVVGGRAAGLVSGYSLGLGNAAVIPIVMIVETVYVLTLYPLFVFSWRHLVVIRRLKNVLARIRGAAEAHHGRIQKYGIIGLFVFVWMPFWMTGPVVGAAIGFLIGLRTWFNLPVVLIGTYAAIISWAFFLRHVHGWLASYSVYAPVLLLAGLLAIIIVGHRLHRTVQNHRNGSEQSSHQD